MTNGQQQPQGQGQQIQIRAKEDDLKGAYSNLMQVAHSQEEFVLDFFNVTGNQGVLASRVILSPGHLKRMIAALEDNVKRYEGTFGQIKEAQSPGKQVGFQAS